MNTTGKRSGSTNWRFFKQQGSLKLNLRRARQSRDASGTKLPKTDDPQIEAHQPYRSREKDSNDGKKRGKGNSVLRNAALTFNLLSGISREHAKKIADNLNENVLDISVTLSSDHPMFPKVEAAKFKS